MIATIFIGALVGHLVGDYLLQTDWMALQKKKSSFACLIHCLVWVGCVWGFSQMGWLPALFLFVCHFIQDRTKIVLWWMNLRGSSVFTEPPFAPWSMIVVDNVLHVLQIWVACMFLL